MTVGQFASMIPLIQHGITRVSRRIDGQHDPHVQIKDETQYDYMAPLSPIQLIVSHEPLFFTVI